MRGAVFLFVFLFAPCRKFCTKRANCSRFGSFCAVFTLFLNPMVLPEFGELTVIKAVQSLGGGNTEFSNWFEALNSMKAQMDSIDYDVCLIGCGAYGFPLAAHAKRTGHQAIHLGGVLQLLFGIKGKRWEDPNYNNRYNYTTLFNDSWVKPGEDLKPSNYRAVEGGCYW